MANINTYNDSHVINAKPFKEVVQTNERVGYEALHIILVAAPIIAGADKYFNFLTKWTTYLAPAVPKMLGLSPESFMKGIGFVEILVGLGVALKPKIFAYVLSAWLLGIVANYLILGNYYDIAFRDFGLAVAAFALGSLSRARDEKVT